MGLYGRFLDASVFVWIGVVVARLEEKGQRVGIVSESVLGIQLGLRPFKVKIGRAHV